IMSDEFERTGKPVSHLNQRLTTEAKSKLREVDFGVLVKQLEDLRTTLVGKLEIVPRRVDPLFVTVRAHRLSRGTCVAAPFALCSRGSLFAIGAGVVALHMTSREARIRRGRRREALLPRIASLSTSFKATLCRICCLDSTARS